MNARVLSQRLGGQDMMFVTHLALALSLRVREAIPLLLLYAYLVWTALVLTEK
jgi:hypothetical protein